VPPTLSESPPKAHLPGEGVPCPSHGEGGSPFEPGRVRGTHASTGGVRVPASLHMRQIRTLVSHNAGMQNVALSEGELEWVFPADSVSRDEFESLERAGERLREIAANLADGRAGWTGKGLEYALYPSGKCSLGGFAENSQVTFGVELWPPLFFESDSAWGVEADISIRCDHPVDCGMHRIELREAAELGDPAAAIAVLDDFTAWLLRRSAEVAPDEWQNCDPSASGG
jgi:hypothetical protein